MPSFAVVVGIVGTLIIGCIAGTVVWRMWTNQINLSQLLSDDPSTSMSRFQFLVFTFIIGLSYLLLVITRISAAEGQLEKVADLSKLADLLKELPGVPGGVLGLMGSAPAAMSAARSSKNRRIPQWRPQRSPIPRHRLLRRAARMALPARTTAEKSTRFGRRRCPRTNSPSSTTPT
jgi:hypothetical protein